MGALDGEVLLQLLMYCSVRGCVGVWVQSCVPRREGGSFCSNEQLLNVALQMLLHACAHRVVTNTKNPNPMIQKYTGNAGSCACALCLFPICWW